MSNPLTPGATYPIGTRFKVITNQHSNHTVPVGSIVTSVGHISNLQATGSYVFRSLVTNMNHSIYADELAMGWASRKEHAEVVLDEIKGLEKQIKEKQYLYERLSKFESDEKEIASLLVTALTDTGKPENERIDDLAKLLKGRLRTDLL